jgi:hypothetical protein
MLGARNILIALVVALFATTLALAAPPTGKGGGGGGGKGGGGGGGPGGGGGGGGGDAVEVYAEMVEIDRDVNGVPILGLGLAPGDVWTDVRQPIMFGNTDLCPVELLDFESLEQVGSDSIYFQLGIDARYIPFVDGEIPEEYGVCMTEAHLGRLSAVRAPEKVLDMALLELVTALKMEGVTIGLDEAGRLQISYYDDVLDVDVVKTIDAPRENLAGFESLLETAELSHPEVAGGTPVEGLMFRPGHEGATYQEALDLMDRAAAMLGGASDKFGKVGLDELMYVSEILTLGTDMTPAAKAMFGDPLDDPGPAASNKFFDFSRFEYNRATTYAGDVCYLKIIDPQEDTENLPYYIVGEVAIVKEPILSLVFPPLADPDDYKGGLSYEADYTGFDGEGVWAFARAVDDARAVIFFVHEHPVPAELIGYCGLENAP